MGANADNDVVISNAYIIRNKFLHGHAPMKNISGVHENYNYNEFITISISLDRLLRSALKKIFSSYLRDFTVKSDHEMKLLFRSM